MDDKKTMTEEEVEHEEHYVKEVLMGLHSACRPHILALSRLAAQAARVPGLEVDLKGAQDALASALLRETDLERQRDDLHRENVANERAATTATAERDAARKEAEERRESNVRLRERVATLESERDNLIADEYRTREKIGLANLDRDKERDLRVAVQGRDGALRASLSTAEARVREVERQRDAMQVERNRALDYQKVLRQRFDTARNDALEEAAARVDVEAQESHTREIAAVLDDVSRRIRDLKVPLTSHPAPTTGAVGRFSVDDEGPRPDPDWHWCKGECGDLTFDAPGGHEAWHREHTGWAGLPNSTTPPVSPTPPPGLLEAVEKEAKAARAGLLNALDLGLTEARSHAIAGNINAMEASVRAAYDAAKGWERGPDSTCPNCKADHEDAAKYRAAVERYNTVGAEAAGRTAAAILFGNPPLPGHLTTPPVSRETLDKARVVEVLRESRDRHREAAQEHAGTSLEMDHRAMADACTQVATRLGLPLDTPPSGPGGGERSPDANAEAWARSVRAKEALVRETIRQHRARIAPTPTQEAQPSAPEVVWEGHGLKVDSDGEIDASESGYSESGIARILARALAEAKREVATLKAAADGDLPDSLHPDDRGNPTLWFGAARSIQTALRRERANRMEFVRKAAESMRERAAKVADLEHDEAEKRRAESISAGHTRTVVLAEEQSLIATRIADDIRALPLE